MWCAMVDCLFNVQYTSLYTGFSLRSLPIYAYLLIIHAVAHLSCLRILSRLLEWISNIIILPNPDLLLLLRRNMLHPYLLRMLLHECSNIPRIPKLARHTQVFAAPHQCIRFATLGRGRYAFWRKVVLLAARDRYKSVSQIVSLCS